jgi:tryptophanyl-tRNA synthetase
VIGEHTAVLKGLDGRKMSKSYNNTIPLFADEKRLRKLVMKIKTNSLEPGEPKDTADSTLFDIYKAFATEEETRDIEERFAGGRAAHRQSRSRGGGTQKRRREGTRALRAISRRDSRQDRNPQAGLAAMPYLLAADAVLFLRTVRRLRRCRTVPDFCG